METTPSSFPFFPTTAPMYVPTTVLPPPPFGFGAPPYGSYPPPPGFVPAAYAPRPDFFPAPPPGFLLRPAYTPPTPFPYPPPAQAYGPFGFYPTAASSAATSSTASPPAPTREQPQIVSHNHFATIIDSALLELPSFPAPAYDSVQVSSPLPAGRPATAPLHCQVPCASLPNDLSNPNSSSKADSASKLQLDSAPLLELHSPAARMQPDHASTVFTDHAPVLMLQDSKVDAFQRQATDRLPSSSATNKNDAAVPAHSPFDSSPEVTTVTSSSPLSSFTQSSGSTKTASTTSLLLSSVSPLFSVSASNVPSTAEYVAPQVFGEMPTPISWQETHGTASDHCSGHHNPIQCSCVSNLSEHNLDGMPQQYGFHNLNRQSVFLADGTDRSYFALPENYPLERVTPEPVFDVYGDETEDCSNACVDVSASTPGPLFSNESAYVFASTPDQQLYEEEQPKTEHSGPCLNVSSAARDITLEVQQDNEKTLVNVRQLKAPPLNMLLTEKREEWDPGILNTTIDGHQVVKWSSLEGLKQEVIFSPDILLSMIVYAAIQGEISRLSEGVALLVTYVGINEQSSNKNCLFATPLLSASDLSPIDDVSTPASDSTVMAAIAVYDICDDRTACRSRLHPTVDTIEVDIVEVEVKSSQATSTLCVHEAIVHCHDERPGHINWTNSLETIRLNFEQDSHGIKFLWDPGILVPNRALSRQTPCTLLILIGQPVDLNKFWAQLLQCHTWCHNPNDLLQVQYCLLPILFPTAASATKMQCTDASESMMVQILVVQSRARKACVRVQHGSDFREGQLAYLPQVTRATEKHLSWLPISELTKRQSQVTSASFIWDPGTMPLGYKLWLLSTQDKTSNSIQLLFGWSVFNLLDK